MVMSASKDDGSNGSPKGLSESVSGTNGLPVEFIRHLLVKVVEITGEVTPSADIQMGLRKTAERASILSDMVREIAPPNVNPVLWTKWLEGGKPPIMDVPERPSLKKPTKASERPANLVIRTTPRVTAQEAVVAETRERLKAEEEHLQMLKAHDAAALQFVIINGLIDLMQPAFAMGPAWTMMRALSSHLSPETAELHLGFLVGKERKTAETGLGQERIAQTEEMMDALDFFSGDAEFEEALRNAVLKVVKDSKARRSELEKSGRKSRSKEKRKLEVHPAARNGADEVVDGLKRAS